MKSRMKISLTCLGVLFVNSIYADDFIAQQGKATFATSLELQKYVNLIQHYRPETHSLKERLQRTIDYYKKVHILKTFHTKTYTVDCIPFAEQPALITKPKLAQQLLGSNKMKVKNQLSQLIKIGENFDFNAAKECPLDSVAILRPTEKMLTSRLANNKIARRKNYYFGGYTWEQGAMPNGDDIFIETAASQAYFKGPQNQYVNPNRADDHSLDQFWYTQDVRHRREDQIYSVEFGIIASSYFTTNVSTSIFVFASVDNYGNSSCYNLECPNFIQAPGTTPIGVPITNKAADYIFRVEHITSPGFQAGFYLTLVVHNSQGNSNTMLLGFYPETLYSVNHLPRKFSAGAEVYAEEPNDGSLMYGNYANPYAGYNGPKEISLYSQNGNVFPYSTTYGPPPYGLIWNLGH